LSEPTIRNKAGLALSKIGVPAIPALIAELRDPNADVSVVAIASLVQIGEPAVLDLIATLYDPDEKVVDKACR
jgi:HEAT repeat protein